MEPVAPVTQFDGFVGQKKPDSSANPHDNRYGYIPPVFYAEGDPRTVGYKFFLPGTLITFRTFSSGGWPNPAFYEDGKAAGLVREFSAELAAKNAAIKYMAIEGHDVGYAQLTMLTGDDRAQRYFDAIHPPFATFQYVCPQGLDVCPTCRIQWLESDISKDYFREQAADLDFSKAQQVKEVLYDANQRFLEFAQVTWAECEDAHERTRGKESPFVLNKTHHHYRRCLHQMTFDERELQRIQAMTTSNAVAIGDAVRGGGTPAGMTDAALADFYAWRAAKNNKPSVIVTESVPDSEQFTVGMRVLCEGALGVIEEAKSGGWFAVKLESGVTSTVRKDKLQEYKNESEIQ